MPYEEINERRIYYERRGTGPAILIVHGGLGMDHVHMKYLLQQYEDNFEFIYYDQRGHGKSDPIDEQNFTYKEFVDDIEELRKALKLNQFYLMGSSAGSYISLMYAEKYGNDLKGLIINVGFHRFDDHPNPEEILQKAKKRMPAQYREFKQLQEKISQLGSDAPKALKDEFQTLSYFSYFYKFDTHIRELVHKITLDSDFNPRILARDVELRYGLNIQLGNITTPTLILAGRYDIIPVAINKEMAELLPNATLHIFEKSGHFLPFEEPKKFGDILTSWVK